MADGWKVVPCEGFEIVVGLTARDNDQLSLREAAPNDFWFHAAGYAGSHVIVRNPDRLDVLPKAVEQRAAELAVWHSKAKTAKGKIAVHCCRGADVSKARGAPPGQVTLRRYTTVKVYSREG